MVLRRISIDQVEAVLTLPEVIRPGDSGTTIVERQLEHGRTLKVYVKGRYLVGAKAIIITAAWKEE